MPSYKQQAVEDNKPWPAGEYEVEIIDAEETKSKSAGNTMIVLKCRVIVGGEQKGAKIIKRLIFTPAWLQDIDRARAALGEVIVPGEDINVEAEDFVGKRGRVILKIREDDDRWNEIDRWVVPEGAATAGKLKEGGDDAPF
jgi:hypothetical protein